MNNESAISLTNLKLPKSKYRQNSPNRPDAAVFARLLHWLDTEPESAGRKYESIRARLIRMFSARRCIFAEDLADATFERVAYKLSNLTTQLLGDPIPYFYGVAGKIYLEHIREVRTNECRLDCGQSMSSNNSHSEEMFDLLDKALSMISKADRELILQYYAWNGKNKIEHRRELAQQLGIQVSVLRVRAFRIRRQIRKHIPEDFGLSS